MITYLNKDKLPVKTIQRSSNSIITILLILLSLMVIFIFSMEHVSAESSIVYVNDTGGNDSWDGLNSTWQYGTLNGPKKSIKNATGTVTNGGTVNIANGVYAGTDNTNINIDRNMFIIGENSENTIIDGNNIAGIFLIQKGVNVTIWNLTFVNGNATEKVTLENENVTSGGAIFNSGNLTVFNCNFIGNTANWGGAVGNIGNLTVVDSSFIYNNAYTSTINPADPQNDARGGAIYNYNGSVAVNNCDFINNFALNGNDINKGSSYGGSIYNDHQGILGVFNSTFQNNIATGEGGAIFNWEIMALNDSVFTDNFAHAGGAVSSYNNADVNRCTFLNNVAFDSGYGAGGAIHNNGVLNVNASFFINNTAAVNGGAIDNNGACTINGTTFTNNTAAGTGLYEGGGAIHHLSVNLPLVIRFSSFSGNNALNGYNIHCNGVATLLDANYNWWGTNSGPQGIISSYGSLNSWPTTWLYMTFTANPAVILSGQTSQITANFNNYYNGNTVTPIDPALGHLPDGSPVTFTTDLGNIGSKTTTVNTTNGTAQATLTTNESLGTVHLSSQLDSQILYNNAEITFNINQIIAAAAVFKNNVDTNHALPSNVLVGGKTVTTPQFLELMVNAVIQLNKGLPTTTTIGLGTFNGATNPKESIVAGSMGKVEYVSLAQAIENYMTSSGRAPDYAYQTSLGTYMRYETLTYLYSTILTNYATSLPATVQIKPWTKIINPPVSFTLQQVVDAALVFKNDVDTNHVLPSNVVVGGKTVTTPQFLELMVNTITQLNKGLPMTTTIDLGSFTAAVNPKESIVAGSMGKVEYVSLAQAIENYMTSSGRAPDYAYQTSLGTYMRYETLTYLYSTVLTNYNTSLPTAVQIRPWAKIINPQVSFTLQQVVDAALVFKNDVDTNHVLPNVVVGGKTVTTPQFLELMVNTITQLNRGLPLTTTIDLGIFNAAVNPKESIVAGSMGKAEYVSLAQAIENYMTSSGRAPDYAYQTSLGTYMRYETLIYLYSTVLTNYNAGLPGNVQIKPWAKIINPSTTFTIQQIITAASTFKNSIDTNHQLPTTVTVNNIVISTPQFLELMANSILQLNKGLPLTTTIDLGLFTAAVNPKESITTGTIGLNEYVKLAQAIENYMTSSGRAPDYAYQTSLGTYMRYETLTYLFSTVLSNYSANLLGVVQIKPWTKIINPPKTFTIQQIMDAASTFKNSIDTNHALPSTIPALLDSQGKPISTSQFLELMISAVIQLNKGLPVTTNIDLGAFTAATNPKESIKTGTMGITEYVNLAQGIENYMTSSGRAPDYAYQTSLGTYMRYETLTYLYSTVLTNYATNLPAVVQIKPWSKIINPPISFTIDEIKEAATTVKNYTEINRVLPGTVLIGSTQVTMPQFLELIVTATIQINNKIYSAIPLDDYSAPSNPKDNIVLGYILKGEYLEIANEVKNYMDANAKSPDYVYETSLGKFLSFQSAVLMFSKILDSYKTADVLPDSILVNPWWKATNLLGSTDYGQVIRLGPYGNVYSPVKIAYIVGVHPQEYSSHQAIIDAIQTYDASLKYCYYIYEVQVTKDANDYEKGRMNGQLLANAFAVPDIINQGFQLAIDIHSNVGNWEYTRFVFSPVTGTFPEAIARDIDNRISWLSYYFPPSQTSPKYVTIPIINAGIPAIIYETYTYESYDVTLAHAREFVQTVDAR